jgi:hypothetical protein
MTGAVSFVKGTSSGAFKARLVFLVWITGLFAALALLWFLTQPVQQRCLLRAVNSVFIAAGDQRRIISPAAAPNGGPPGFWYSMMDSKDRLFVFGIIQDGILIPCGDEHVIYRPQKIALLQRLGKKPEQPKRGKEARNPGQKNQTGPESSAGYTPDKRNNAVHAEPSPEAAPEVCPGEPPALTVFRL